MKNTIQLSIPTPCSEKWSSFTHTETGGFCSACSKTVVDFTKMNDDQVISHFKSRPEHSCGKFRPDQLKAYSESATLKIYPGMTLLKAGLLSLMFIMVQKPSFAQVTTTEKTEIVSTRPAATQSKTPNDHIIKGVVKSADDGQPLAGVNIFRQGFNSGTITDANGHFEFPDALKEGDVLFFSFVGMDTQEYTVPNKVNDSIEIRITMNEQILMGAVAVSEVYIPKAETSLWSKIKGIF